MSSLGTKDSPKPADLVTGAAVLRATTLLSPEKLPVNANSLLRIAASVSRNSIGRHVSELVRKKPEVRRAIRHYARTAYTEAILEAAERLFLRVGYHDAKMADLAEAAGVAVGTLYKYFASKEEVFASLAARGREQVFSILSESAKIVDPNERLRAIVERLFGYVEERGALFAVYVQLGAPTESHIRSMGGPDCDESFGDFVGSLQSVFIAE